MTRRKSVAFRSAKGISFRGAKADNPFKRNDPAPSMQLKDALNTSERTSQNVAPQVFILSPANCSGQRAAMLMSPRAEFFLARQLRDQGATLGEVFSFLSGLYFRGKLTYARAFARPPKRSTGIAIITAGRGLMSPDTIIQLNDLRAFAEVPIDIAERRYREPLIRDAAKLAQQLPPHGRAVLLGSIASNKYVEILQAAFGERLVFPQAFVGRGDMSRGGLLLRAVDAGEELTYTPILGSVRRGARPAKLPPRR